MSASKVLTACAAILPVGTTIPAGSVVVQKGLALPTLAWPGLILNIPRGRRQRMGIGQAAPYQWTHQVHALYLDRWDTSTRSLEQILKDADTALDLMIGNISSNALLTVGGVDNCAESCDVVDKFLDGAVQDPKLGFPLVQGYLVIEVKDFWETWTPG